MVLAPNGDRAVPASLDCLISLCRQDTASYYIVTTMLAPSGDRAVPVLFDLLYCHNDAFSKWRQGGAHITGLFDFCT